MFGITKKKTKTSISWQFASIFVSLMIGAIAFFLLINSSFLETVYTKNKEKVLKETYYNLENATKAGELNTAEFEQKIEDMSIRYNIDIIVVDVDSQIVVCKGKDPDKIRRVLLDRLFLEDGARRDEIIEDNDKYQMVFTPDKFGEQVYLELWGFLSNDNLFLMRTAMQSVEEAASIANKFLLTSGVLVIIVGAVIVWLVSKRLTKPILELTEISEKMRNLDFEAKYTGNKQNEIGLLGNNINMMSDALEKTISELKTANIELQKDIEEKEIIDDMRSEFISNVSHELKTPIAIIQGYAEGLVEGISEDKESRDYYCNVILDEAHKMSEMVRKFMTLNEAEYGRENISMERFDIATMIAYRLEASEVLAKQKGIVFKYEQNEPIYVWSDQFKTEEVFTNYLSNAINHCQGDMVIKIYIEKTDDKVRINVFNTGEQIPEESIPHLFEKFYKVDKARTRGYGGSGIGLSIVKAIQDSLGQKYGIINCDDGVLFWFELEQA